MSQSRSNQKITNSAFPRKVHQIIWMHFAAIHEVQKELHFLSQKVRPTETRAFTAGNKPHLSNHHSRWWESPRNEAKLLLTRRQLSQNGLVGESDKRVAIFCQSTHVIGKSLNTKTFSGWHRHSSYRAFLRTRVCKQTSASMGHVQLGQVDFEPLNLRLGAGVRQVQQLLLWASA